MDILLPTSLQNLNNICQQVAEPSYASACFFITFLSQMTDNIIDRDELQEAYN